MTHVVIYQPCKTPTQSGKAKTMRWVLAYKNSPVKKIDPIMGWTGSGDTQSNQQISFQTLEEAIAFAEEEGLVYEVLPAGQSTPLKPKNYSDNFQGFRDRL